MQIHKNIKLNNMPIFHHNKINVIIAFTLFILHDNTFKKFQTIKEIQIKLNLHILLF